MEYLYACHFSNGHIKVGRTIEPKRRVFKHSNTAACFGIKLSSHYISECVGSIQRAEIALINRCAESAIKRNKSEWFEGLDYPSVCCWLDEFASATNAHYPSAKNPHIDRNALIANISPKRAMQIEKKTNGKVTRKELRPKDWQAIWPELAAPRKAKATKPTGA